MRTHAKVLLLLSVITISLLGTSSERTYAAATNSDSTASAIVKGTLPILNSVTATGGNLAANISSTTGALGTALAPTFQAFTNNPSGVKVTFQVTAATNTTAANALTSTAAGSTGKIALTNATTLATNAAVANALAVTGSSADLNANVISYGVTFAGSKPNTNPAFTAAGDSTADTTAPRGTTDFTVTISGAAVANTYDADFDDAGTYQSTITCTVANP